MTEGMKPLINQAENNCFGCGPANAHGLKMEFFTDETRMVSRLMVPAHLCGWDNLIHGGITSTILDEIMSWAAIYLLKRIILTKSMTIDYLKPIYVGQLLTAEGLVLEKKNEKEALMSGRISNESGTVCATSVGTYALIEPRKAERLNIMPPSSLDAFGRVFGL